MAVFDVLGEHSSNFKGEINKMNKTFKIIVKSGTLSLPSGAVVFFGGDRLRQPRDGTMLDETPGVLLCGNGVVHAMLVARAHARMQHDTYVIHT